MRLETIELAGSAPGTCHTLTALHYGQAGGGPKAYIQAALHADEVPALLVAQALRRQLQALEDAGLIHGQVCLVPYANPIGLGQELLGQQQGRFHLRDGVNFNRHVPEPIEALAAAVDGRLTDQAAANVALIRSAWREALQASPATNLAAELKRQLMLRACDADIVLDLHCDAQAVVHLYGLTPQAEQCAALGAHLGAQAILLATMSGDSPFDEACSRPWLLLQQRYPAHPIPLACFSTTVELRGECDTNHALAELDAAALIAFLREHGVVGGPGAPLPAARCEPTPLASSETITAPCSGVLVFHAEPGQSIEADQLVADLVDIDSGEVLPLRAQSAGLLYARVARRWAQAGMGVAKIAGTTLQRSGKLLGP